MRNNKSKLSWTVLGQVESLPYFTLDDLARFDRRREYLKIILSRAKKKGEILRLKKGIYASRTYVDGIEKRNAYSDYLEFAANVIYDPSYLSLEYVLEKHGALTESPKNFTLVSTQKTASFKNELGSFFYHHVKPSLFIGFGIVNVEGFSIAEATKAKALFDFLYLRKNTLFSKGSVLELRLNLEVFSFADRREIKRYVELEGSKKMKEIYKLLF